MSSLAECKLLIIHFPIVDQSCMVEQDVWVGLPGASNECFSIHSQTKHSCGAILRKAMSYRPKPHTEGVES